MSTQESNTTAPTFPHWDSHPKVIPLTALDDQLRSGIDQATLPPKNADDDCLVFHSVLREIVSFGSELAGRLMARGGGVEDLVIRMLYRAILERGDAIALLLRFGSANPGAIVLRSLFESQLYLKFLMEGNKVHTDRINAYWAGHRIQELETFKKYDPNTTQGKEFHQLLESDANMKDAGFRKAGLSAERKVLEAELAEPPYRQYWDI